MSASRLQLMPCHDAAAWDAFVAASPQQNVFCHTPLLAALGADYDLWFAEEAGAPVAGAVILKRNGELLLAPHEYTMYIGLLLAQDPAPSHRSIRRHLEVCAFLTEELLHRYPLVSFCLHHTIKDVRAFQWINYHDPERGRFSIDVGYTALLDLSACQDFDRYLSGIRMLRRRDYAKANAAGLQVAASADVELLSDLHERTFARQGMLRPPEDGALLQNIAAAAIADEFGELLVCSDSSGRPLAANLCLRDHRAAYYLFGANDPASRDTGAATLLMLEQIRRSVTRGLSIFDFVGINSPNRGDFKTSFNAVPTPYFIPTWKPAEMVGQSRCQTAGERAVHRKFAGANFLTSHSL